MTKSTLRKLTVISILEGISLVILLFVAMPLKYIGGYKIATLIVGSAHGILWLAFLYVLNEARIKNLLNRTEVIKFFILSVVPFGFIPMKKSISSR
ncbi:DUF3817 domain-containing protein [Persephonella sp.]